LVIVICLIFVICYLEFLLLRNSSQSFPVKPLNSNPRKTGSAWHEPCTWNESSGTDSESFNHDITFLPAPGVATIGRKLIMSELV
jgi:hypothetical protein